MNSNVNKKPSDIPDDLAKCLYKIIILSDRLKLIFIDI